MQLEIGKRKALRHAETTMPCFTNLAGRFCTEGPKLEFGGPMQADSGEELQLWNDRTNTMLTTLMQDIHQIEDGLDGLNKKVLQSLSFTFWSLQVQATVCLCDSLRWGCRVPSLKQQQSS